MSGNDWDTVLKIGSKAGPGGGGGPREKTVKNQSQLNAAMRAGNVVGTDRKYGTSNSGGSGGGQRLTMVDRADGPVKPNTIGPQLGRAIVDARTKKKDPSWDQKKLSDMSGVALGDLKKWENGTITFNEQQYIKLENALGVYLRGANAGLAKPAKKIPKYLQKQLDAEKKAAAAAEKAEKAKKDAAAEDEAKNGDEEEE